ncbi:MAG TPA: hypothetical protein VN763_06230, partial [Saprospiraceae bacterium]|nr:hypothetical protein [Saprospiraceae bacterium]
GISLGAGVQNFQSEIEYIIPDPSHLGFIDPVFDRHDQMNGRAAGPVLSLQYRNKHIRASFGLVPFQYGNTQTPHRSSVSSISIATDAVVIAHIQIDEEIFWRIYGTEYDLYQFGAAYEVLNRLFLKIGFESTITKRKYYPYTTRITGFTVDTGPEDQLLNDFKMSNAYSAFSIGVEYVIGFGKYKEGKIEE